MTSVATSEGAPIALPQDARQPGELAPTFEEELAEQTSLPGVGDAARADDAAFSEHQVAIVDADGLRAMGELATGLSYLWVPLDPPGPQHRGRLGLYLEEAIEQQLEERGALPPGIQASTGLDASLSDQLYRARLVEMRGIALGIPSLEGITNLGRSLDAEDSAVLRWWIAAAADRPVHLVISSENTRLRVYPSPVLFETLFDVAPAPVTPLPPSLSMAESSESMEMSDFPPDAEQTNVLGTEVGSLEEIHGTESLSEDHAYDDYSGQDDLADVDLPELDRALGLAPDVEETKAQPSPPRMKTELRSDESPQLPLDYESPVPAFVNTQNDGTRASMETRIASPAPPPQESVEVDRAEQASFEPACDESSSQAPVRAHAEPEPMDSLEKTIVDVPREGEPLDEIDEDEFLRTLEEDSAKAPHVTLPQPERDEETEWEAESEVSSVLEERRLAGPSDESGAQAAPSPLPTKKIARNPFIRMANPTEAVFDGSEEEEEVTTALAEEPEPAPAVATAKDPHTATLAGQAAPDPNDPFNQLASREWKTWVKNLEAARGPKPLSVIERMFVTDYTRLREAVRRGVADSSANSILDEWQESFSKSYSEAFDALRVRGKRPTMVLDIVEMAGRLGRLQGAKRVQLLMVDGLRFDLGLMVQDRMRQIADAALTERLLLWSALPSVTQYQLELLGKGADGLKEQGNSDEAPALVARGAAARVPRRVRTGRLELHKLDVVEDCLREVGAPVFERMDAIADETAQAISEHLQKQPPRTMVVAFGDHGFALDPSKAGTTEEVRQGGSSPEEVLVPAFAWLTGAVH